MATSPLVLVTCATGNTGNIGGHVAQALHRHGGFRIRIGARNVDKATKLFQDSIPQATYVYLDLSDISTYSSALDGVDKVFLGHPEQGFDDLELQQAFMDAVSAAKPIAPHVVKFTASYSPEYVEIFEKHAPLLAVALKNIQEVVSEFKVKHGERSISVVEGCAWFYQQYVSHYAMLVREGALTIDNGDGPLPRIDSRDIAEVVRALLADDSLNGSRISLAGAVTLTESDLAAELSAAIGRKVAHSSNADRMKAEQSEVPIGGGLTLWDVTSQLWAVERHWTPAASAPRLSPEGFLRLTGKPFRTWSAFALEHRDCEVWSTAKTAGGHDAT